VVGFSKAIAREVARKQRAGELRLFFHNPHRAMDMLFQANPEAEQKMVKRYP